MMACIVYHTDAGGRKYAYSSESYWDKSKGQPRSRRKYLGRVDEDGNIIKGRQNGKNYKPRKQAQPLEREAPHVSTKPDKTLDDLYASIDDLRRENSELKNQLRQVTEVCQNIASMASNVAAITSTDF